MSPLFAGEHDEAHILNNPIPRGPWRSDQRYWKAIFLDLARTGASGLKLSFTSGSS